ncbi:hypothetical protein N1851_008187 [Merluccius polli]|uniref:Uncharacterized protein n=1 Tax=Merluccius polli TaxID=89951 RepID=A0AA47N1S2_MERPO|nr:hypothetical protein N1851_008187 [Merluccius polli]
MLETEGIEIPTLSSRVCGSIVQVVGDNLGLNCIFGLKKRNFNKCFMMSVKFRTKDEHLQHCNSAQSNPMLSHVCGVKRHCLLNTLQYFNTSENVSVDVMHDILEGIGQLEMKLVLQYLKANFVTSREIALRVQHYGYTERKNRPPVIKLDDDRNDLGINAIQCWCLLRNLPLMFDNIVFSPVLTEGLTVYLKYLIGEHHRVFKLLFPEKSLLPKHHLLTHYPRSIRHIGPVIHMWCMRYEGKHNYFKRQLKSFKNITKTLAKKHQRFMAYSWESISSSKLTMGPGRMMTLDDFAESSDIAAKLNLTHFENTNVLSVKWVKHQGIVGSKILLFKMKVFFIGQNMETVCLDSHFNAFKVATMMKPCKLQVVEVCDLVYYRDFDIQMSYDKVDHQLFVVPYCVMI